MKTLIPVVAIALVSASAQAAGWRSAIWMGMNHGVSATGTVTVNGTTTPEVTVSGQSAFNFGAEYYRVTQSPVNLSFILENSWIKSDSNSPASFSTSLLIGPRFETNTPTNFWATVAAGPAFTTVGSKTATSGGLTATLDSTSIFSFVVSPRFGIDIPIGDKHFVGLQVAYFTSAYESKGRYSGSLNANYTENATLKFFTTAIRLGWSLGEDEPPPKAPDPIPPMPTEPDTPTASASPTPAPASGKLDVEELLNLKKLRDAGVLTEKEYQERKSRLLK